MSDYRKFDFVCDVLEQLAQGSEVVIDKRRIFRLDTSQYSLKDECADVLAMVKEMRQGNPLRGQISLSALQHAIVGELREIRVAIVEALPKKKGRKS